MYIKTIGFIIFCLFLIPKWIEQALFPGDMSIHDRDVPV